MIKEDVEAQQLNLCLLHTYSVFINKLINTLSITGKRIFKYSKYILVKTAQ